VAIELETKPGGRAPLKSLMEQIVAEKGPSQNGSHGITRYEALDNPDLLIESADFQNHLSRHSWMRAVEDDG
jgi:hypothetical protein